MPKLSIYLFYVHKFLKTAEDINRKPILKIKALIYFLNILNRPGYKFTRDFILKTSLILIGTGAKYDVQKFRKEINIKNLRENWDKIKATISDIRDFIHNNTFIRSDQALPSYLALIIR